MYACLSRCVTLSNVIDLTKAIKISGFITYVLLRARTDVLWKAVDLLQGNVVSSAVFSDDVIEIS
jgi:hypothetical protein